MKTENIRINKILLLYCLLAILPTVVYGMAGGIGDNKTLIWIWDVVIIIIGFVVFFINRAKFSKRDLAIGGIYMVIMSIQLFVYKQSLDENIVQPIYFILPIVYLIHMMSTFVFLANTKIRNIDLTYFMKGFLYFTIFAAFYNVVINFNNIMNISSIGNKYINIASFFSQRNAFGQLMFLGVVCNTFLILNNKEKKYYITLLCIIINLVLSFSRTAIFSTLIFLGIVYFFNNINTKSKQKIIKIVLLILSLCILVFIFSNHQIREFIEYYILRKEDGLTGRSSLWSIALSNLTGLSILFGRGLGCATGLLAKYSLSNTHNTIIEIMLSGGIVLLAFYIYIYVYVFRNIKNIKNKKIRTIFYAFYFSFIAYSLFEKVVIFSTGYAAVFFTIFLVVLPILYQNNER